MAATYKALTFVGHVVLLSCMALSGCTSATAPGDDPRADPQQQEALAVLRRLLDRKVRARGE